MKRNVLLINPHIEDFAAYDHFSKPLGLLWIASYLKKAFNVSFINALDRLDPSNNKIRFKEGGTGNFNKIYIDKPQAIGDIPRNFKRYGLNENIFLDKLESLKDKPDFIFVTSSMTYWYTGVNYTIKLLRKVFRRYPGNPGGSISFDNSRTCD